MEDGTFRYTLQRYEGGTYYYSPCFEHNSIKYRMLIRVCERNFVTACLALERSSLSSSVLGVTVDYTVTIAWSPQSSMNRRANASFCVKNRIFTSTTGTIGVAGKLGIPLNLHGSQVTIKFNDAQVQAAAPAASSSSSSSSTISSSAGSSASTAENGMYEYRLRDTGEGLNDFEPSPRFKYGRFEFNLNIRTDLLGGIFAVLHLVTEDIDSKASAVSCDFTASILWFPARSYWGDVTSKGEFSAASGWKPHRTGNIGEIGKNGVPRDLGGFTVRLHIHSVCNLPPMSTKEVAAKNSGSTSSSTTSSSAGSSASTAENGLFKYVLQQSGRHQNVFQMSPVFKYGAFEFNVNIFLDVQGCVFAALRLVNKDIDSKASAVACEFTVSILWGVSREYWGEVTSKGEFSAASGWKAHQTGKIGELGVNGVPMNLEGYAVRLHIRSVNNLPPMMITPNKTALDEVVARALENPASSSSQGRPANSCANYANCKRIGQFCINCRVHVCNACCITHHRPLFKDTHTLVAYQSPWCESHGDSHEHYCTVCETLVCPRCYIEKHLDHYGSMISVAHHANNRREQLAEKRSFVDVELERLRKVHESLENEIAALEFQKETLSAITKHHEDVNAMVLFVSEDKLINETEFSLLLGMIKALKSTGVAKK